MYKTKQFTLIFNSLHPKTVQSPLIIFWTSGPFKYFLARRILNSENITNKIESCRSIFCRIEVNFMKFNTPTRTSKQSTSSFVEFTKNTIVLRLFLPKLFSKIDLLHFRATCYQNTGSILSSSYQKRLIRFLGHLTTRNA